MEHGFKSSCTKPSSSLSHSIRIKVWIYDSVVAFVLISCVMTDFQVSLKADYDLEEEAKHEEWTYTNKSFTKILGKKYFLFMMLSLVFTLCGGSNSLIVIVSVGRSGCHYPSWHPIPPTSIHIVIQNSVCKH